MTGRFDPEYRKKFREFLREYKRHVCLWDTKNAEYNNRTAKDDAKNEICRKFGLTEKQLRFKISAVRTTYYRIQQKIAEWAKLNEPYQPMLFWYKDATFLPPLQTRPPKNSRLRKEELSKSIIKQEGDWLEEDNVENLQATSETTKSKRKSKEILNEGPNDMEMWLEEGSQDQYDVIEEQEVVYEQEVADGPEFVDENGTAYVEYIEEPEMENVEIIYETAAEAPPPTQDISIPDATPNTSTTSLPTDKDEFSHFGEFLSCQLRSMPQAISIELMSKIHAQISEARMRSLGLKK